MRNASNAFSRLRPNDKSDALFRSTRRRLVAINLAVVAAILLVMASAIYGFEAHSIDQQVKQELVAAAQHDSLHDLNGGDNSGGAIVPYNPSSPNVFALVIYSNGQPPAIPSDVRDYCTGDPSSAAPVISGQKPTNYTTVQQGGHEYALYTVPLYDQQQGQIIGAVQIGTSLDASEQQLHDLLFTLGSVGLGVLLLTALASLYLADRALTPMRLAFARQRQFAAAASHELRTPLSYVRSQSELVLRHLQRAALPAAEIVDADQQREARAADADDMLEIVGEVDYMTRLVRDLLLLARDESDTRGLTWQTLNFSGLAAEAAEKARGAAEAKQLTLTVDAPKSELLVRGDPDRLRQLALILLENAIHYTPAGGSVRVSVESATGPRLLAGHHGQALLKVTDSGIGIQEADLNRIFEPFYRADAARTKATDGDHSSAGLGLALARWIVNAHGGAISASSSVGKGSTFTVTLPLTSHDS